MFGRRINKKIPELNTTSTADISFVLLILFLVTTSLDPDKGLTRILPSLSATEIIKPSQVKQRNILEIKILADGSIRCRGNEVRKNSIKDMIKDFIENSSASDTLPEKTLTDIPLLGGCMITKDHVISIETHRDAPYSSYFGLHDAIDKAYRELRDTLATRRFGITFAGCNDKQREAVERYYPQHISEVYNTSDKEKKL